MELDEEPHRSVGVHAVEDLRHDHPRMVGIEDPIGYVISVLMIGFSLFALWASALALRGRDYATLQRGGSSLARRKLTPWHGALAYAWIGFVLLLVLSPHIGILLLSFASVWSFSVLPDAYTVQHYATVVQDSPLMIWNTLLYCGLAALIEASRVASASRSRWSTSALI